MARLTGAKFWHHSGFFLEVLKAALAARQRPPPSNLCRLIHEIAGSRRLPQAYLFQKPRENKMKKASFEACDHPDYFSIGWSGMSKSVNRFHDSAKFRKPA